MVSTAPPIAALGAAELAKWVDASCLRADGLLFTGTARTDLDEIASWQRLADLAFAGQCRAIVAACNRASRADRDFVPDEVGLAIGASPTTGSLLTGLALDAAALPRLLEAVETGLLTERHVRALLTELTAISLELEQRAAIVLVALTRFDRHTPAEFAAMVRRLIITVDPAAAQHRQDHATRQRRIQFWTDIDGQGCLQARGPLAVIAAVKASLEATAGPDHDPADQRSTDARLFDTFTDLLTGGADGPGRWEAQIIVPVATAQGDGTEPAEIPGFVPVLASTAHELVDTCDRLRRVSVDIVTGQVIAVDDAQPVRRAETVPLLLMRMRTDPVVIPDLTSNHYRPSRRLTRLVQARDRTCTCPGCHRRASRTDKDHRIPWPLGPTDADNLQSLCRHHNRAKHTSFTVTRGPAGRYLWTSRGGHQHRRRPKGH